MTYSPVELRHVRLKRGLVGYRRAPVERLLEDVADSFETVWRERADLADRIEQLETELARQRELEALLRTTLISAERTARDLRDQASREATTILEEAHLEARSITREARAKREALVLESRRIRTILQAVLNLIDDGEDTFAGSPRPPDAKVEAA